MRLFLKPCLLSVLFFSLVHSSIALEWSSVASPDSGYDHSSNIRLTSNGKRIYAVWVGRKKGKDSQLIYSSIPTKKMHWENPQALFYGDNLDRVVAADIAMTRDKVGITAIRKASSKKATYEAFYSFSGNSGWEFSPPAIFERFALADNVTPSVRMAALRGSRNSEFLLTWSGYYGDIQYCVLNPIRKTLHAKTLEKLDDPNLFYGVESRGPEGFYAWWLKGKSLFKTKLTSLTNDPDEKATPSVLSIDQFVASTSREKGPAYIAGFSQGGPVEILTLKGDDDPQTKRVANVPLPGKLEQVDITQKEDDELYFAAVISRKGKYVVIGRNPEDTQWQTIGELLDCDGKELSIQLEATKHNLFVAVTDSQKMWCFQTRK